MAFLLYHQRTAPTGRELAEALGIEHGTEGPENRPDFLIRWGSVRRVPRRPENAPINSLEAVSLASNKLTALESMAEAGVHVPEFGQRYQEMVETIGMVPMLGRHTNGMRGRDVELILQPADAERAQAQFYTRYIPKSREFRVHVIGGRVAKVSEKISTDGYDNVVWNFENGFTFRQPQQNVPTSVEVQAVAAIHALGLTFGAADVVYGAEDNNSYVLEVNTAPGMTDNTLEVYTRELRNLIGG